MTAYEELLEFGGERIFDFLKNARLHESQFKYSKYSNDLNDGILKVYKQL